MSMFHQAALFLNEDMYHEFKIALALGHWRSGEKLTAKQRKICQEVVSIRDAYTFEQPETAPLHQQAQTQESWVNIFTPSHVLQ